MTSSSANVSSLFSTTFELSNTLRFQLFLIFDLLALICTIFVLYHLLNRRRSREALQNHATILILILAFFYEIIDIPLQLDFFRTGHVRFVSSTFCLFWLYVDYCFYFLIVVLLVFISFQRHFFIFHHHWFISRRKRWLLHYLPLLSITLFMLVFYGILMLAPICESRFDYNQTVCGMYACYSTIPFFLMFERIAFSTMPCFLIIIFNVILLIRVIRQKYRVHHSPRWRKQRKLAIQVFLMSSLYVIFGFPLTIIYLVRMTLNTSWASDVMSVCFFLTYFVVFLLPCVCLSSLSKFWKRTHRVQQQQH